MIPSTMPRRVLWSAAVLSWLLPCVSGAEAAEGFRDGDCGRFTVAVIPDTQNYVDYRHQSWSGFPFDAVDQFYAQMHYIAGNARSNGGDIVFATHVGDLWQHYSEWMDPVHEARGFKWMPNLYGSSVAISPKVLTRGFEIPAVVQGFRILKGRLPFSVVPGNHDYDALWTDPADPPRLDPATGKVHAGRRHVGGLDGFHSAFSEDSEFFRGQSWYVGAHDGGADSAQVFHAGQCRFLHIGLQYHAPDASLQWAAEVIAAHPGLPTIVTTHDYLDRNGERNTRSNPQNSLLDPQDNGPQAIWDDFIRHHAQIFLVLSGHVSGQSRRVDLNRHGHEVHQLMADFQGRGQSVEATGGKGVVGDGWLRLLDFDLDATRPSMRVRTYSTHYRKHASELPQYARWYARHEGHPEAADAEFVARDEFTLPLAGFHARFGGRRAAP